MDYQDSYGCRGCSNRNNVLILQATPPEGRELLRDLGSFPGMPAIVLTKATKPASVLALEMVPVVPPKSNRAPSLALRPAPLQETQYEIERLFRRLKDYVPHSSAWIACSSLSFAHRRSAQIVLTRPSSVAHATLPHTAWQ